MSEMKESLLTKLLRGTDEEPLIERLMPYPVVLRKVGSIGELRAELDPCDFTPVEGSIHYPFQPNDLCKHPQRALSLANRAVAQLMDEQFKRGLKASDWNNVGCLLIWKEAPEWDLAKSHITAATKASDFDALPEKSQEVIRTNITLLKEPEPADPIIQPWGRILEIAREDIEAAAIGEVPGVRVELG